MMPEGRVLLLSVTGCCALTLFPLASAVAADASQGESIAERWCATCHRVERNPKSTTDQPPPFASIVAMPDFDANKLAFLLLRPHPSMPNLTLSRAEVSDLAEYMKTLR